MTRADLLFGRDDELAAVDAVLSAPASGRTVLVHGCRGSGRTRFIREVRERGESRFASVVTVTGDVTRSEHDHAGVERLLRSPGGTSGSEPPGARLLRALDDATTNGPLLLCVDDADRLDTPSREALASALRRLAGRRVTVLLTMLECAVPQAVSEDTVDVRMAALPDDAARLLLASQPYRLPAHLADHVIAQSAGIPAALIAFGEAVSAHGAGYAPVEPLPLPVRLQAAWAGDVHDLPAAVRAELLVLAAARPDEIGDLPADDPEALAFAESTGIIETIGDHPRFAHPMLRSALYHDAPITARREAHQRVSRLLAHRPHRQLRHLAKAAHGPDEKLATALEHSGADVLRFDGNAAAAAALQRAAELSTALDDRARRLLDGAVFARRGGHAEWAQALARDASAMAIDASERRRAYAELGLAAVGDVDYREAFDDLRRGLGGTSPLNADTADDALRAAAMLAYLTDDDSIHRFLRDTAEEHRRRSAGQVRGSDATSHWMRAVCTPSTEFGSDELFSSQAAERAADHRSRVALGAAAWLKDAPDLAVRSLATARGASGDTRRRQPDAITLTALVRAQFETGRYTAALQTSRDLGLLAHATDQPLIAAIGQLTTAAIATICGELDSARADLTTAVATFDVADHRALGAWVHHVNGLISMTAGDYTASYGHLSNLFSDDGTPMHRRESYLALADYATAAVLGEHTTSARRHLGRILERTPSPPSPRIRQLIAHASGLLAEQKSAGPLYAAALTDPAGRQWPLERARLQLSYGGWLRRHRKVKDAREQLAQVLAILTGLRAEPWIDLCNRELRSSGVRPAAPVDPIASALSPQEHHVVYLVSLGWTNPQIAARLRLSPRTVAGHLYRSFPKLGVTRRSQIREIPPPNRGSDIADVAAGPPV